MARPQLDIERIKRELPTAGDMLDKEYGKEGTPTREQFNKEAMEFYKSQIRLHEKTETPTPKKDVSEKFIKI